MSIHIVFCCLIYFFSLIGWGEAEGAWASGIVMLFFPHPNSQDQ